MRVAGLLVVALLAGAGWSAVASAQPPAGQAVYGSDVGGRRVLLLSPGRERVLVLFFVATDCPISNRELPEMKRVREKYTGRDGVRFWFVYPNTTESREERLAHLRGFDLGEGALSDAKGELARLAGATVTPEAAVLVKDGARLRTVYAGRIDDRYLALGKERPQASRHDLDDAVAAAAAGQQPRAAGGPPVGCGIVRAK